MARRKSVQNFPYSIHQVLLNNQQTISATNAGFSTPTFTMSTWCKPTSLSGSHWEGLMLIYDGTISNRVLLAVSQNLGSNFLGYYDNTNGIKLTTVKLNTNVWQHVAMTKNGTALRYYVNSVPVFTDTLAGAAPTSVDRFGVGTGGLTAESMEGDWTGARFFTSVLTDAQIADLYYDGRSGVTPFVEYLCTEGSGSTVADTSGNGLTGTINLSTWSTQSPTKARTALSTARSSISVARTDISVARTSI